MTRAAPDLFKALQDCVDAMSHRPEDQPIYPAVLAAALLDRVKEQLLDEEAARTAAVDADASPHGLDIAA